MENIAIVLASGTGERAGLEIPKQFIKVAGKTVLEHTIEIFEANAAISQIIVVIVPSCRSLFESILIANQYKKVSKILNGGETRKESSYIGISAIEASEANVIIHDSVRPFLSQALLNKCLESLEIYDAVDVAIPCADTIIEINDKDNIKKIPNRASLRRGQTPQCFKLSLIKKAHQISLNDPNFTDDCGLIIKNRLAPVAVITGEEKNIKITYPIDFYIADKLFQLKTIDAKEICGNENLKNKIMVIFGGTSGIGQCLAKKASANGAKVFVFSSSHGCNIKNINAVRKALKAVYDEEGKIDIVVNTVGVLKIGKLDTRSIEDITEEINVNYLGAINCAHASLEYLRKSQGKMLLFTSSSYTRGRALYSIYSSTKAALVNLTQALAEETFSDGIQINIINPSRTATPMRFNAFGKEPPNTLLTPIKVAEVCISVLNSGLTGQVIDVRR